MSVVDVRLEAIRAKLAAREARPYSGPAATRRAAVAAILRAEAGETEVLLIRRAEREGDPWSGHMAFPGGHEEPGDADLLQTAVRETREEVGIDLRQHELLGALDQHPAMARGGFAGVLIAPFVFAVSGHLAPRLNHEVAELVWAPLGDMVRGDLDVVKEMERDGRRTRLPAFGVHGHVVWGLTHRVLTSFFEALAGG